MSGRGGSDARWVRGEQPSLCAEVESIIPGSGWGGVCGNGGKADDIFRSEGRVGLHQTDGSL